MKLRSVGLFLLQTRSNSLDSRQSEPIIQNLYGGPKQIGKVG